MVSRERVPQALETPRAGFRTQPSPDHLKAAKNWTCYVTSAGLDLWRHRKQWFLPYKITLRIQSNPISESAETGFCGAIVGKALSSSAWYKVGA